ncbi:MAG: peptide ABC transporter ATP-binding protein, partial [Planctomycetes bacterium]|nr:peptide ABC transporter ATP-binding protein [Planctomycetota bacterium]
KTQMLVDAATSALDPEMTGEGIKVMRDLSEEGMTMVVVTHEMGFAREVANRIVFMDNAVIVEEGAPDLVFDSPESERLALFLQAVL